MRRRIALLLAASLATPPAGAAAAAPPAGGDAVATCPPGRELQRQVRRKGKARKRVVRWACVEDRHAPTRVTGLAAVPGDGQVVLTWKAAQDAGGLAGYEIYRDGRYVVTIPPTTTFTDPSLVNGVAHQYRVFAVDMARNLSKPSGVVWALPRAVPDVTPPAMPAGVTATADATALTVTLRWTPPADDKGVVGYRVYRDGELAGTSTQPLFVDPERSHGKEYRYTVVALDAAGNISPAAPAVSTYVS